MTETVSNDRTWDRERAQARLDGFVHDNRFTVAVVFPLVGAVGLVASEAGWLPAPLAFSPTLLLFGTAVMRLPLAAGLAPLVDRRAVLALTALVAYAYVIETAGVLTGFPYGSFEYGVALGPMLGGVVPAALPVFFVPLVANSYLLCLLLLGDRADSAAVRLPAVVAAVVAVDLVLDPAAVGLGFWGYGGGPYYGVPLSNYAGWVLSAVVSAVLLDRAFDRTAVVQRVRDCEFALDDLVSFVLLWGAINAWFGNWLAVGVAGLFFAGILRIGRFDFALQDVIPPWLAGRD
ncbi:MAG: bisanhydrobacterioruberin hydratase [Haloarculaceae archaeon]